ncbi:hypothetical protein [Nocardia huaxiensis]|uniref:mRNA interferase MazF n=1 Tax=Nocardia huaxiensis TaxID=2755382 RepID=A0A7D6ZHH1_9NOCA|nr:hypothetical protein [Nocardia huaxiensis]QLY33718.1 hypothetical protein H0264_17095 [Nocardia huaxiensis]UFS99359.1 hypothetical protein LPY97_16425 [Nocardia huaxiensis]
MTEPAAQGELWRVRTPSGQEFSVIIVDSDAVTRLRPTVLCALVREARDVPPSLELLTVRLPGDYVIAIHELAALPKEYFVARQARLAEGSLEEVKIALRARFDL